MSKPVLWESMTSEEIAGLRQPGMDAALFPIGAPERRERPPLENSYFATA